MNSRHENPHDLLSLWVFRNGAKKTHLVPKGKNFLCVLLLHETLQYVNTNQNRVELSKFFFLKKKNCQSLVAESMAQELFDCTSVIDKRIWLKKESQTQNTK